MRLSETVAAIRWAFGPSATDNRVADVLALSKAVAKLEEERRELYDALDGLFNGGDGPMRFVDRDQRIKDARALLTRLGDK